MIMRCGCLSWDIFGKGTSSRMLSLSQHDDRQNVFQHFVKHQWHKSFLRGNKWCVGKMWKQMILSLAWNIIFGSTGHDNFDTPDIEPKRNYSRGYCNWSSLPLWYRLSVENFCHLNASLPFSHLISDLSPPPKQKNAHPFRTEQTFTCRLQHKLITVKLSALVSSLGPVLLGGGVDQEVVVAHALRREGTTGTEVTKLDPPEVRWARR